MARTFSYVIMVIGLGAIPSPAQQSVPQDRDALLKGEGMGLASAAERNGYPGPKHVLELKDELGLTVDQVQRTQALIHGVRSAAVAMGEQVVSAEEKLDRLFSSGQIEEKNLQEKVGEIGKLRSDLRAVHLQAHLQMKRILTEAQIAQYKHLRGHEIKH